MPTRRIWRYKTRVDPLTVLQWAFFLVQDVAGFDRLFETGDSGQFFYLYYADGWKEVFAAHREEIEKEWARRSWSKKQREFVLMLYLQRRITLKHDAERERRMALWRVWNDSKGWKTENWQEYLNRNG
jgi:hypothetical protein